MPALCHELLALLLALPHGFHPRAARPQAEDDTHQLWTWLDDHGDIVFPLVGLAVIALVIYGIRRGMTTNVAELRKREERKDRIVRMMRSKLLVSAEAVAGELQVDPFAAHALLEELVREGKLVEQRMVGGVANYRLKGL